MAGASARQATRTLTSAVGWLIRRSSQPGHRGEWPVILNRVATEEDLRSVALALPEAYEHASYGGAASYRTKPRAFAHLREEVGAVVVFVPSEEDKHALVAASPTVFFTTPHFDGHAAVLVRLAEVSREELEELVTDSWRLRAPARAVRQWDAERATK